jgi:AraC family transcriptional regulator, alkane utilization regulator
VAVDALSELLRAIRLSGAAFIDAELSAPWSVQTPPPIDIAKRFAAKSGRIIPYHLVAQGGCWVELDGEAPLRIEAGEAVMFPSGDIHVLSSERGLRPMRITTDAVVRLTRPDSIASARFGCEGAVTRLVCGFFACDEAISENLIAKLPRRLHCKSAVDGVARALSQSVHSLRHSSRPGAAAVVGKLSELLFVDAVRAYIEALPELAGWLAGLKDQQLGRALALFFSLPDAAWTLESIAAEVGISRTALADRFLRCTGMAPMQFLAQWRMRMSADALAMTDRAIKSVAESAGFNSTEAFSRAFKRQFGRPPAQWRRERRQTGAGQATG